MSEQRPTPRTEAELGKCYFPVPFGFLNHAHSLERELAETVEVLTATVERLEALDPTNPQAARARELLGRIGK